MNAYEVFLDFAFRIAPFIKYDTNQNMVLNVYISTVAHCEGNHEKSIPSVSPGFITISIGVHPSRSQIKNKILRLFQT